MQADPERRRKRRRIFISAIVLTIVSGAAFVVYAVDRYSPLEPGSTFGWPEGSVCTTRSETGEEGSTCRVTYTHRKEASFAFSVRNGGSWGVTIVDLPILHQTGYRLFKVARATVTDTAVQDPVAVPFKPFALQSGDELLITLYGTFADCEWYVAGSGNRYDAVTVGYRVGWASAEASIALPSGVHVISPPDAACPTERPPDMRTPG